MLKPLIQIETTFYKRRKIRRDEESIILLSNKKNQKNVSQCKLVCLYQGISLDLFELASHKFLNYWPRFFREYKLNEVFYNFSYDGDFQLCLSFQVGNRTKTEAFHELEDYFSTLFVLCLREVDEENVRQKEETLRVFESKIRELQRKIEKIQRDEARAVRKEKEKRKKWQQRYEEIKNEKNALERTTANITEENTVQRETLVRINENKIAELQKSLENLQKNGNQAINEEKEKRKKWEQRYEELKQTKESLEATMASIAEEHTGQREEILRANENKIISLERNLENLRQKEQQANQAVNEEKEKRVQLQQRYVEEKRAKKSLEEKIAYITEQNEFKQDKIMTTNENKIIVLERELKSLRQKEQQANRAVSEEREKREQLQQNYEEEKRTKQSLKTTLNHAPNENLKQQEKTLRVNENKIIELQRKLETFQQREKQANQAITEEKEERERLEQRHEKEKLAKESLEAEMSQKAKEKVHQQEDILHANENKIIELERELESLRQKEQQASREVKIEKEKREQLQQSLEKEKQAKESLKEEIAYKTEESAQNQAKVLRVNKNRINELQKTIETFQQKERQANQAVNEEQVKSEKWQQRYKEEKEARESLKVTMSHIVKENAHQEQETLRAYEDKLDEKQRVLEAVQLRERRIVNEEKEKSEQWQQRYEEMKKSKDTLKKTLNKKADRSKKLGKEMNSLQLELANANSQLALYKLQGYQPIEMKRQEEKITLKYSVQKAHPDEDEQVTLIYGPGLDIDEVVTYRKSEMEEKIKELFQETKATPNKKRVKLLIPEYYVYKRHVDFLEYHWTRAMLFHHAFLNETFLKWCKPYVDKLPYFLGTMEEKVIKNTWVKKYYYMDYETFNLLKGYELLSRYLEVYSDSSVLNSREERTFGNDSKEVNEETSPEEIKKLKLLS